MWRPSASAAAATGLSMTGVEASALGPAVPNPRPTVGTWTQGAVRPDHAHGRAAQRRSLHRGDAVAECRQDDRRRPGRAVCVSHGAGASNHRSWRSTLMSNNNIFRIAGIAGILSAILMLAMSFSVDPVKRDVTAILAVASSVVGIVLVAGLYLLVSQRGVNPEPGRNCDLGDWLCVVRGGQPDAGYVPQPNAGCRRYRCLHRGPVAVQLAGLPHTQDATPSGVVGFLAALAGQAPMSSMSITGTVLRVMTNLPPWSDGIVLRLPDRGGRLAGLDGDQPAAYET